MDAISYTAARKHLARTIQQVCENHQPVIITHKEEQAVVMMSLEDYQSLQETSYLLRSPRNAQRLLQGISQLEQGKGTQKSLEHIEDLC